MTPVVALIVELMVDDYYSAQVSAPQPDTAFDTWVSQIAVIHPDISRDDVAAAWVIFKKREPNL